MDPLDEAGGAAGATCCDGCRLVLVVLNHVAAGPVRIAPRWGLLVVRRDSPALPEVEALRRLAEENEAGAAVALLEPDGGARHGLALIVHRPRDLPNHLMTRRWYEATSAWHARGTMIFVKPCRF